VAVKLGVLGSLAVWELEDWLALPLPLPLPLLCGIVLVLLDGVVLEIGPEIRPIVRFPGMLIVAF
jgi:hypothetical protein